MFSSIPLNAFEKSIFLPVLERHLMSQKSTVSNVLSLLRTWNHQKCTQVNTAAEREKLKYIVQKKFLMFLIRGLPTNDNSEMT
jgi:hypothetical protein